MFSCITKTHGTEDYKGFLVKILALNFTKAHFETSQINKKIKLKEVPFGLTERDRDLMTCFLKPPLLSQRNLTTVPVVHKRQKGCVIIATLTS